MKRGRSIWSTDRVVELALLAGAGGTAEDIAPAMALSEAAVRKAAIRFGISLPKRSSPPVSATGCLKMVIDVPVDAMSGWADAAAARSLAVPDLIAQMAATAGREGAGFIANVLDDGRAG